MSDALPTIGLDVQLEEFAKLDAALSRTLDGYSKIGGAAEATADKIDKSNRDALNLNMRMAKQRLAQEQAISADMLGLNVRMAKQRAAETEAAAKAETASTRSELGLRMRLAKQHTDQVVAEDRRRLAESKAASAEGLAFNMRMTRQQTAEIQRAAQEAVAAEKTAAAQRRQISAGIASFNTAQQRESILADQRGRAAALANAEARTKIVQAEIEQIRTQGLTRASVEAEAAALRRLSVALAEVAAAKGAMARAGAGAIGANGDLAAAAAGVGATRTMAAAQGAFDRRAADVSGMGPQGFVQTSLAVTGLGRAMQALSPVGNAFKAMFGGIGEAIHRARVVMLDAKFAVALLIGAMAIGPIANMADAMTALNARVGIFAKTQTDVPITMERLYEVAQRTRQPLEGIATLYTRLAPLADQLGKSQADMVRITETVAKSFAIGGASAAEATASAQQLAQALASNRLGGDELRSLSENAPVLLYELSKSLGMSSGAFIKWAHEGKANAAVVIKAIEDSAGAINDKFGKIPMTIGQSVTMVGNSIQRLIDQVNQSTGASAELAASIAGFSSFLESQQAVDLLTAAITGLTVGLEALGTVAGLVKDYFPLIATVIAMVGVRALATSAGFVTLTASMAANGISTVALRAQMAGMAAAMSMNVATMGPMRAGLAGVGMAASGLMKGLGGVVSLLGGGLVVGVTAAAAAFSYMTANTMSSQQMVNSYSESVNNASQALNSAAVYMDKYGFSTSEMTDLLLEINGVQDEQVAGLDEAGRAAVARAANEQTLTAALLMRAAAESRANAAALRRGAGMADLEAFQQGVFSFASVGDASRRAQERQRTAQGSASLGRSLADKADATAPQLEALAASVLARKPALTTADTRGTATPPAGKPDKSKGGKGDDQTQNALDRLKKEAEQSRATTEAIRAETAARDRLSAAMTAFYASGSRDGAAYAEIIRQEKDAVLAARQEEERRRILAANDEVMREDKTGGVRAEVMALIALKDAELAAADAAERANEINAAREDAQARIADLKAETEALERGTDALVAYGIKKRELELIGSGIGDAEAGGLAAGEDRATAGRDIAARNRAFAEQMRYAAMTATEAERAAKAQELSDLYMRSIAGMTRETADQMARVKVNTEEAQLQAAELKSRLQDAMRSTFIETGKLDFKGLRDGMTKALRQAIYDSLIAKPITIIVNAAVNALMGEGGSGGIAGKLLGSLGGGGGGMSGMLGTVAKGIGGLFGLGGSAASAAVGAGSAMSAATASAAATGIGGFMPAAAVSLGGGSAGLLSGIGAALASNPVGWAVLAGSILVGSGILKGKKSNEAAVASLDAEGRVTSMAGGKRTAETEAAATSVANAIRTGQEGLTALGATLKATVASIDIGTRDSTHIGFSDGRNIDTAMGDQQAAVDGALLEVLKSADFMNDTINTMVRSMAAAGDSFQDITAALQEYKAAQQQITDIQNGLLKYTDPTGYAIKTTQDQQLARRKSLTENYEKGYYSADQMAGLEATLQALERNELADALSNVAGAANDAADALADIRQAQKEIAEFVAGLTTSAYSPLNPQAQLQEAAQRYNSTLAAARGGNVDALGNITSVAQDYLSKGQGYYASSSDYASIFNQVQSDLSVLSTASIGAAQGFGDQTALIDQAMNELMLAVNGGFSSMIAANSNAPTTIQQRQIDQLDGTLIRGFDALQDALFGVGQGVANSNYASSQQIAEALANQSWYGAAIGGGVV